MFNVSFSLVLLVLLSPVVAADNNCPYRQGASITGVAVNANTNEFLYCEYHFYKNQQQVAITSVVSLDDVVFSEVEYRDADQQLIAKKSADFSQSRLAPMIDQVDFRHKEKVIVQPLIGDTGSDGQKTTLDVRYHEPNTGAIQQTSIDLDKNTVVDAGFDNAIRIYWNDILSKKKVILEFVAPAQQTSLGLSVKTQSLTRCETLGNTTYTDEQHLCVKVKAANVILSWLVKPIYLVYERNSKRLLMFSGHVNITDNNGQGQTATISYRYL